MQDVSSIVDLCRQCIVFEDLKDIAACMRVIEADCDVRVLRVKNRLDLKHSSSVSAGYRDVGMNLQIISAETRNAGIDTHIFELQLIYKPVAELKVNCFANESILLLLLDQRHLSSCTKKQSIYTILYMSCVSQYLSCSPT